jgi:hypothetical protein
LQIEQPVIKVSEKYMKSEQISLKMPRQTHGYGSQLINNSTSPITGAPVHIGEADVVGLVYCKNPRSFSPLAVAVLVQAKECHLNNFQGVAT